MDTQLMYHIQFNFSCTLFTRVQYLVSTFSLDKFFFSLFANSLVFFSVIGFLSHR